MCKLDNDVELKTLDYFSEKDRRLRPIISNRIKKKRKVLSGSAEPQDPEPKTSKVTIVEHDKEVEEEGEKDTSSGGGGDGEGDEDCLSDDSDDGDRDGEGEGMGKGGKEPTSKDDIPEELKIASLFVLKGFQSHVANFIYQGTERAVLKCHSHLAKLRLGSWMMKKILGIFVSSVLF